MRAHTNTHTQQKSEKKGEMKSEKTEKCKQEKENGIAKQYGRSVLKSHESKIKILIYI